MYYLFCFYTKFSKITCVGAHIERKLSQDNLPMLTAELFDLFSEWKCLATELGLSSETIDRIARDAQTDTEEKFTKVLTHWVDTGEATYESLLQVLQKTTQFGRTGANIAAKLQKKFSSST